MITFLFRYAARNKSLENGLFDEEKEDPNDQENDADIDINSNEDADADENTLLNLSSLRGRQRSSESQSKCKSKVERSKPTRLEFDWKRKDSESGISPHENAFTTSLELLKPID
ncbi:hypothetical protein HHI36_020736 [Cryptolaemus montrouzieri]|uniref:Uncharacterized protein n=1 Tax=Cryptolaemus montrouzieri TaxID=559131 RepID=A0ABD2NC80_9CUCU